MILRAHRQRRILILHAPLRRPRRIAFQAEGRDNAFSSLQASREQMPAIQSNMIAVALSRKEANYDPPKGFTPISCRHVNRKPVESQHLNPLLHQGRIWSMQPTRKLVKVIVGDFESGTGRG